MNKKLKGFLSMAVAFILAFSLWVPAFAAEAASGEVKLTIIHTNDVHSRVDGEAYVSQLKKDREAAGEAVLLFNAGDTLHGQPFATISQGDSIVEVMNAVGYDAMAPGNHDFNYALDRLMALSEKMDFPMLSANVLDKATGEMIFTPYIIKEMAGVKVGIFGLTTPETTTKTNPENIKTLTFEEPAAAAERAVSQLKSEGAEIIIGVVHMGLDEETLPAERSDYLPTKVKGIDLLVDGHSHTVLEEGKLVDGTLIAQTGEYLNNIGVVEFVLSSGEVKSKKASLVPVLDEGGNPLLAADEGIVKIIEKVNEDNKVITAEVIGKTPVVLQGERADVRTRETNLSDLITDAMLYETGADIAITNGGGIRASVAAGDITKGDILTVHPFGNYIVTMDLKGSDVLAALELGVSAYPEPAGAFSQVAGIRFTFDPEKEAGNRVTEVTLEESGEALSSEKIYRVATNNVLAAGGDNYVMLMSKENYNEYGALDEVIIRYIQTGVEIVETTKERVTAKAALAAVASPTAAASAPAAAVTGEKYTVEEGDVLWKVAQKFKTTWEKLAERNHLANPHLIFPGQVLTVE